MKMRSFFSVKKDFVNRRRSIGGALKALPVNYKRPCNVSGVNYKTNYKNCVKIRLKKGGNKSIVDKKLM